MSETPGPSWKAIMPAMQDEENQTEVLCYPHFVTKLKPSTVWRNQQCQTLISIGPFENNADIYATLIDLKTKEIEKEYIDFIPLSKKFHVRFSDLSITPEVAIRPASMGSVVPSILKSKRANSKEFKFI